MSVSALTTLGAVRDSRAPTKRDVGKATSADPDKKDEPGYTDLLVTAIPTELVAPYTALTAMIVGAIDEPTRRVPTPDEYEIWRWGLFLVLVLATAFAVYRGKQKKSDSDRFPRREIGVAVAAAAGWALALPNSPLIPLFDGDEKMFVPAVAAFTAIAVIVALGGKLKRQADAP